MMEAVLILATLVQKFSLRLAAQGPARRPVRLDRLATARRGLGDALGTVSWSMRRGARPRRASSRRRVRSPNDAARP